MEQSNPVKHHRIFGYPVITEISKNKKIQKVNIHDPKFDRPLSELYRPADKQQTIIFKFKIK